MIYSANSAYGSKDSQFLFKAPIDIKVTSTPYQSFQLIYENFNTEINQLEKSTTMLKGELEKIEKKLKQEFSHGGDLYWECIVRVGNLKEKWKLTSKSEPVAEPDLTYPLAIEYMDDALLKLNFNAFFDIGREARKWTKEQLMLKEVMNFQTEEELLRVSNEMLDVYGEFWKKCLTTENEQEWFVALESFGFARDLVEEKPLFEQWLEADKSNIHTLNQLQIWLRRVIEKESLLKSNAVNVLSVHPFMQKVTPSLISA